MKKVELAFTAALVPLDYLAIVAAGIFAYYVRFHSFFVEIRPVIFDLTIETFTPIVLAIALLWIAVFAVMGLYQIHQHRLRTEILRVFLAASSSMAVVFAILFFSRSLFDSRFIVLAFWLLAFIFIAIERMALRSVQRSLVSMGIGEHRVIIIGKNKTSDTLLKEFKKNHRLGFHVTKQFSEFNDATKKSIKDMKNKGGVDEILLTEDLPKNETLELLAFCETEHLGFKYSADLFAAAIGKTEIHTYGGMPVIEVKRTPLDGWGAIYKRGFDIIASLILIILISPFLILTTISILIETGFPIIFKNERVGEKGAIFQTLKFRSMKKEFSIGVQKSLGDQSEALKLEKELIEKSSKKQGPIYKIIDDPRITKTGRFIRKYSIDELPQLFNVLMGSMSLVGPRPHQPREVAKYKPYDLRVLAIKPGISGLAQISGRSDLSFEEEIRLDTYYIEHWSPWLDLYILIKTPLVVLFRKGAY